MLAGIGARIDSVGAHIFNQFWVNARGLRDHFATPFDLDDPVNTPAGLTTENEETRALIVAALEAGVAFWKPVFLWMPPGEVQFAMRNGEKIGIPGGSGEQGLFSVITARFNPENGGYLRSLTVIAIFRQRRG